ncbi:MAG: SDR family oxidoreductase [Nitrospirota bacterium]
MTAADHPDYCPVVIGHGHHSRAQDGRPFAVVTGSSRGIGAAYAHALASKGYDLLLVARDQEALDRLRVELSAYAVSVSHELIDLSEPEAAHRLYVAACQFRGLPDLLVNNAGFGLFGEFAEMPMARIQQMLRLHVNTVVESMRLFLPGMVERRSGAIVNVASIAGLFAVPHMAEYAATKAFLINFSQALDEEVRRSGVRIQVCCPGSTDTEFHRTAGFRPRNPFGSQRPEKVVRASLSALKQGPSLVTVGVSGVLLALVSRCVPRRVLIRGAGRWMKSPV